MLAALIGISLGLVLTTIVDLFLGYKLGFSTSHTHPDSATEDDQKRNSDSPLRGIMCGAGGYALI